MSNEKMREDFESAYSKRLRSGGFEGVIEFKRHEDGYANFFTDGAWWGWQASRESLVIELPPITHMENEGTDVLLNCAQAIHAAGVKTK